jgi:uncharacterized protein
VEQLPPMSAEPGRDGPVASPCNSVCRMDADGVYCIGCFRTLDEIAGWAGFDDARRRLIWEQLRWRRSRSGPTGGEPDT